MCALASDELRLREFTLGTKEVRDFIFLAEPATRDITESTFEISKSVLPDYQNYDPLIKKFLFDLFTRFRSVTHLPDLTCLHSLQHYLQ